MEKDPAMKKILVPIDFSDFSDNALDYALFLADELGSQLCILHVMSTYRESSDEKIYLQAIEESLQAREKELKEKIQALLNAVTSRGLTIKTDIIRSLSVPAGIINYLEEGDFDLVIMGNQGKTGISNWLPGSVSEKIIRLSPVPVLTIHKDWTKREINKILVPVDFSEGSRQVTRWAQEISESLKAKLEFLFVIEEDDYPDMYNIRFHFEEKENEKLEKEILENLADFTGIPLDRAEYTIKVGLAHHEIKEYSEESPVDLITMSKTGQNLFDKILIGSTTERIIRISICPVLTIPFTGRNTSKTEYHLKLREFLAGYIIGLGRTYKK